MNTQNLQSSYICDGGSRIGLLYFFKPSANLETQMATYLLFRHCSTVTLQVSLLYMSSATLLQTAQLLKVKGSDSEFWKV